MKKKKLLIAVLIFCIIGIIYALLPNKKIINEIIKKPFTSKLMVPEEYSKVDNNKNGVPNCIDIVNGARREAKNKTKYKDSYYAGGYPPEGEGVCTDVIWRGLKEAGIDFKKLMDEDIKKNTKDYTRIAGKPDPNIDFRRVVNQDVFYKKYCESITTELKEGDVDNLKQWQPGDIVVFTKGYEHVAIVSDKRDNDGIPFVIHNTKPHAKESKLSWFQSPIHGHYRWKYTENK